MITAIAPKAGPHCNQHPTNLMPCSPTSSSQQERNIKLREARAARVTPAMRKERISEPRKQNPININNARWHAGDSRQTARLKENLNNVRGHPRVRPMVNYELEHSNESEGKVYDPLPMTHSIVGMWSCNPLQEASKNISWNIRFVCPSRHLHR